MNNKLFGIILFSSLIASCVSIPKETVTLSETIGADLKVLHDSHRSMVQLYYNGIRYKVNAFIDDVYSPFVIHHVLESELIKYRKGESSIYSIIEIAGKTEDKSESEEAMNVMLEFQEAAIKRINTKRNELLFPILNQETEILTAIDQSYQNTLLANSALTAYLVSVRKVKEGQNEALSIIGLNGIDTTITNRLLQLSESVNKAVEKGEMIDLKSNEAQQQIEDLINKIKDLTNKETK